MIQGDRRRSFILRARLDLIASRGEVGVGCVDPVVVRRVLGQSTVIPGGLVDIEDRAALQAEARESAVQDAQARAEHLAGLLGMAVGEPLEIIEGGDFYGPMSIGTGGGGMGFADAAPISQGQLSVNMQVTITFALVPAN